MPGLFVTGTDTDVGKTVLSAALLAAMAALVSRLPPTSRPSRGSTSSPTCSDAAGHAVLDGPPDHELLGAAAGMAPDDVAPLATDRRSRRSSPPSWPASRSIAASCSRAAAEVVRIPSAQRTLIVEGAGGLLSPLARN